MIAWLRELLQGWLCGDELRALERYRRACALVYRWNGGIAASSDTAEWIRAVGEDARGADIEQFRDRLRAASASTEDDAVALARALSLAHVGKQRAPRWSHVGMLTSHGSGLSTALCRRFGLDPDEVVGGNDPVTWAKACRLITAPASSLGTDHGR